MTPSPSSLSALGMTSWWSAAARASESQRHDRLFDDPWATILVGLQRVAEFDRAVEGTGTGDLHAVVTRFFDDLLLRVTTTESVEQVVLVASGLDSRAFRLVWPPRIRLFELEQPQVLAYKDSKFSLFGATPRCERKTVGVNLNGPWIDSLLRAGFQPTRRSVWILEGFLYFLAESSVQNLLTAITYLAAPGSWIGLDIVNREMLTSPATCRWNERMAPFGAPWLFTADKPGDLLARFGWSSEVIQAGEEGANFGRFPDAMTSRSVPGVPCYFLVTATRD